MKKIRILKVGDLFTFSNILEKLDLKIDFNEKATVLETGIRTLQEVFENLHQVEDEVTAWFADLIGVSLEEYQEMPLETTLGIIKQLKENKNIKNFFKGADK